MSEQPQESTSASGTKSVRIRKTSDAPLRAILVIHGVGQQLPFQPLDNFANGLRATLQKEGKEVSLSHFMRRRDEGFDHCVRVEGTDAGAKQPSVRVDVHEFYWAPLTQGKASLAQMLRWLLITGFTPVRRLAFNLPLLFQRAEKRAERTSRRLLGPPEAGQASRPSGGHRWWRRGAASVLGTKAFWLSVEFLRELWRLIYVAVAAAVVAALTAGLVSQSAAIVRRLPATLGPLLQSELTWRGTASIIVALAAAVAALALLLSVPEQIRHLARLRKVEPVVSREVRQAAREGYRHGNSLLGKLFGGGAAGFGAVLSVLAAHARWRREIRDRLWLLPLSVVSFVIAASLVIWLSLPEPACVAGIICPTAAVHAALTPLMKSGLPTLLLLLGAAFFLTRVFVDYLGDVALYTMAAENSTFFQTRVSIQKEMSQRLRDILRDRQYESVAIAGHSLGSVIGYDAISLLRAEVARGDTGEPSTVTREEFAKLTTFVTFGSPLNKVLYFFRTKIRIYETVRSHIVRELLGFRQQESLIMRDPALTGNGKTGTLPDKLRWLNFYSPMDPISGRLIYFSDVNEHRHWYALWGYCHMSYWHDATMYREIMAVLHPKPEPEATLSQAA